MPEGYWPLEPQLSGPVPADEWPAWLRSFYYDWRLWRHTEEPLWVLRCLHCTWTVAADEFADTSGRWHARVALMAHQQCHAAGAGPLAAGQVTREEPPSPIDEQIAVDTAPNSPNMEGLTGLYAAIGWLSSRGRL